MLYPVIKWCIQKNPIVWFTVWGILWTLGFEFFLFGGQSILYFSLGVFLQKRNFPLHKKPKWLSEYLSWAFFIGLCTIKTFMAFELEPTTVTFYTLTFLHTGAVISGITAIWYSSDFVVQWCMSRKWFLWLSGFSFFIYGFHVPLLPYAKEYFFAIANSFVYYRLLAYIVVPVFILFFCIAAGAIMKNYLPRVYKLLTGGRGF
jgi:hypothetical protein